MDSHVYSISNVHRQRLTELMGFDLTSTHASVVVMLTMMVRLRVNMYEGIRTKHVDDLVASSPAELLINETQDSRLA